MLRKLTTRFLQTGVQAFPKEISPVAIKVDRLVLVRNYSDNPVYNTIPQVRTLLNSMVEMTGLSVVSLILLSLILTFHRSEM